MNNKLTVTALRYRRDMLEVAIGRLALEFELSTGVAITGLNLFRHEEYMPEKLHGQLNLKSVVTLDWDGKMKVAEGVQEIKD